MSKLTYFLVFLGGAAIGSAATWRYAKKKYEQIAQEEIDSVKAIFSKREEVDTRIPDISEYDTKLHELGYANYVINRNVGEHLTAKKEEMGEREMSTLGWEPNDRPYVISPDEFGEFNDYDTIDLTYYSDGVLVDEDDELVEDIEEIVGVDSLNHFGEYEDDSVFVRNDRMRCDYEILLDHRTYSEAIKNQPPRTGV